MKPIKTHRPNPPRSTINQAYQNLAAAVVLTAVEGWRELCRGKPAQFDCNFTELCRFFEFECEFYLLGTRLTADSIFDQLKMERRDACGDE